ncbi:MAG: reverse transcriptase family protein, partial [Pirellulaceae bacterium]|nr:reverse transcriptase family protein [Pirellulaceae bacterium]
MHSRAHIAGALATSFVAGHLTVDELVERGAEVLGRRWRWLPAMARSVADSFLYRRPHPRQQAMMNFILADPTFLNAFAKHRLRVAKISTGRSSMRPPAVAEPWPVRAIDTVGELAKWLEVSLNELDWFAAVRRVESGRTKLSHYRYRLLAKRFGRVRLIESPKPRLKKIQRSILTEILDHIPPHEAAHGFRRGRSIKTFAAPHVGRNVVIKIDLQDFFPSIAVARVQALFRTAGYHESVADVLAALCTTTAPDEVWVRQAGAAEFCGGSPGGTAVGGVLRRIYSRPHLPQGAPTSPSIANLAAYRLDCRLAGLASSAGAQYTRYADDLVFSGNVVFGRSARRFQLHACAIALQEGFQVHHRKTRIMRQGNRQSVAGIVVNSHINTRRDDFDRLKATLTNCIRFGAETQNRTKHDNFRSHLD